MRRRLMLLASVGAVAVCICAPATSSAAPMQAGFKPYAPDSVWNLPLRDDAAVDPNSASYMAFFNDQVERLGSWVNLMGCGTTVFFADAATPRVSVRLDHPSYQDPALMRAWSSVPIPADARPANCADLNMAIVQPQPNGTYDMWEFFKARQEEGGGWVASWGGVTQDMQRDRGIASLRSWYDPTAQPDARRSRPSWNVTASSVSTMAGLITLDEIAKRRIDHTLSIAITGAARSTFRWPAQRTDGGLSDAWAVPEGARLRVDPSLDLSQIKMTPLVRTLAEAAQRYGIVVRDTTGGVNAFLAEEPPPGSPNPMTPHLDGQYLTKALKAFPWSRLQMLDAPVCSGFSGCGATQKAVINADRTGDGTVVLDTTNSVLNHPRTEVRWDFDGDGTFELAAGTAVKLTVPLEAMALGATVQIATRDGSVLEAHHEAMAGPVPVPVPPSMQGSLPATPMQSGGHVQLAADPAPIVELLHNQAQLVQRGSQSTISLYLRCNHTLTCAGTATVLLPKELAESSKGKARLIKKKVRYRIKANGRKRVSVRVGKRTSKAVAKTRARKLTAAASSTESGRRVTVIVWR